MRDQEKRAPMEQLLMESFKELAKKRPIEKITIKEITDQAGVIRPTFYNHFQDKYELIEKIVERELLDPVQTLIKNNLVQEVMLLLFTGGEGNELTHFVRDEIYKTKKESFSCDRRRNVSADD